MVDRRDQRIALLLDLQQAVAEALVVVHDVEVVTTVGEQPRDTKAERQRLAEARRPHRAHLEDVDPVAELTGPRSTERVGFVVETEARDLGERDACVYRRLVELGIRLSREDLDLMPQQRQFPAEMAYIDALPTAMRLAAIRQ